MTNLILTGDCLQVLKDLETNSVDSLVCDPPYGIKFMNRKWDYDLPAVEVWREVLRVLKPGAHGLVACGTRTQHRMAVNLEDAGFQIRDVVAWIYGSGFPKSLNIGKAIDKIKGNERETIKINPFPDGLKRKKIGVRNNNIYQRGDSGKLIEANDGLIEKTVGQSEFEGWGTALKPAMELWTLIRKPLSEKNIPLNVLKHKTGGLNIAASRIKGLPGWQKTNRSISENHSFAMHKTTQNKLIDLERTGGDRWPANIIHDGSDEVLQGFPESDSFGGTAKTCERTHGVFAEFSSGHVPFGYGDRGSAARFFYCAKASQTERDFGLAEFEKGNGTKNFMIGTKDSGNNVDNSLRQFKTPKVRNTHPTVKPLELMKYLITLITPPGGIVLDPYAGSGSTLVAAKTLNFDYIGIEREAEYIKIINARLNAVPLNLFSKESMAGNENNT